MKFSTVVVCWLLGITGGSLTLAGEPLLRLEKGDHICLIGNTLAERMQHDGWLETLLYSRFPQHELVIRNLGFSGDEIDPAKRIRSQSFGTPDEWLSGSAPIPQPNDQPNKANVRENRFETAGTCADVIFAFFGYNESFAGPDGLALFKRQLDEQLKHMLAQRYNGTSAPRIVLFSPIAHENFGDVNLSDGKENNQRLALYTAAMAEVAKANGVAFVDLFGPSQKLYQQFDEPLTINGVHLNEAGDKAIAEVIDAALFGRAPPHNSASLEKLRAAVRDKNFYWFNRYRATDGFNVHGGRAFVQYTDQQTNYEVVQRELEILDVMIANRERAIWSIAQGKPTTPDDSNLPPLIPVKTNKPGPLPGGKHVFLTGEEAISHMKLGQGVKVNLFASEEQFPELVKPVQMAWDTKGRLWVAAWPTYPHWTPTAEPMDDKLLIFEDTNGDGRADLCKTFAGGLHNPTGFEFYGGGVLLAAGPDLLFLEDTDGDDKADRKTRLVHGLDTADTHHTANSFVLDPGGALYFQEGIFHRSQVETPWGPPRRLLDAGVFRFEPRSRKFDVYVTYGFANPHGHVFDHWGQDFVTDGTTAQTYWGVAFSGHLESPNKHPAMETVYPQRTRPCSATEILSSGHFPDDWQDNLLVLNVIGFQGILRYKIVDKDSGFSAQEQEPVLSSDDPNFRPTDVEVGPDGAIYFTDWHNPIIGHLQHHVRDPSRDKTHGRIYRVTYEGRELLVPPAIAAEPIDKLLDLLKSRTNRVRYRAKIELSERPTADVVAALEPWIAALDKDDADYTHHLLEGLWLYQYHNAVNVPLLEQLLVDGDYRARAAATRVVRWWRDRVPNALPLLKQQANDQHSRVRLEAVVALSHFPSVEAADIALDVLKQPMDYYLNYALKETMRGLEPHWKPAIAAGRRFASDNPAGADYVLGNVSTAELLNMPRSGPVYLALLSRPGLLPQYREEAIRELAKLNNRDEVSEILAGIERVDRATSDDSVPVLNDLATLLTSRGPAELAASRQQLQELAASAARPLSRQIAYVAMITADGNVQPTWQLASRSAGSLVDLLDAVALIPDAKLRADMYPLVEPLLNNGAEEPIRLTAINAVTYISGHEAETFATLARFVREGNARGPAVQALHRISKNFWPSNEVRPLAEAIVEYVAAVPVEQRTNDDVLSAMQLAGDLAALLPAEAARPIRAAIGDLGVSIVQLRAVPHRMLFDRPLIAVQAGKPVEMVFDNTDIMPHNLVITAPGAMAEIGEAAEKMATQPDAYAKQFVPESSKVLHTTKLLQPREVGKLKFVAPVTPGEYPFVCTFPGHWRTMYGTMVVVENLEKYLEENPLPPPVTLVEARPFVRQWMIEDFSGMLGEVDHGRSFERGQQLFAAASCIACHKMREVGGQIGPDLTELPKKLKRAEILRELLDPSQVIEPKFRSQVIVTDGGQLVTGIVIKEDEHSLHVMSNPLEKCEPRVVRRDEIDEQTTSTISIMPLGLMYTLNKEEILDLIAYLESAADSRHSLYQK